MELEQRQTGQEGSLWTLQAAADQGAVAGDFVWLLLVFSQSRGKVLESAAHQTLIRECHWGLATPRGFTQK